MPLKYGLTSRKGDLIRFAANCKLRVPRKVNFFIRRVVAYCWAATVPNISRDWSAAGCWPASGHKVPGTWHFQCLEPPRHRCALAPSAHSALSSKALVPFGTLALSVPGATKAQVLAGTQRTQRLELKGSGAFWHLALSVP